MYNSYLLKYNTLFGCVLYAPTGLGTDWGVKRGIHSYIATCS